MSAIPFGWFIRASLLMMSRGDFLTPMAMVRGAVFAEVAGVRATVVTGGLLPRCVRIHPGRRHFDASGRVCQGFR